MGAERVSRRMLGSLAIGALAGCTSNASPPARATPDAAATRVAATRAAPSVEAGAPRIYGVTVDSIGSLSATLESLRRLSRHPTTRLVFDENEAPDVYRSAVSQIHAVSDVMGELLDSYFVKDVDVDEYRKRTEDYVAALGNDVDIWEIANEINGEWTGSPEEAAAKMATAYDVVKAARRPVALTLYYNDGCFERSENEMFTWARKYVSQGMADGLDYVLLSYYEDDCKGPKPDWPVVFSRLGEMYPRSRLGFGEVGTKVKSRKAEYVTRYYRMQIDHPRFIGGYFWWYFRQDMTPPTAPLWSVLNDAISA